MVAIIGIIAAIAIPNLLNALNRGRQKRSMADMRPIGTAIEASAVDLSFYPQWDEAQLAGGTDLVVSIEPTYVRTVPRNDGWRQQFWAKSESRFYSIGSAGRDLVMEANLDDTNYVGNVTTDMDCDIVYSNGSFMQYPEGIQTD